MSAQFHETMMGRRFIEGTMPSIMRSLERIADALEKMNEKPQGGLLIGEITKVSPEVQEALKGIAEDVVASKSALIKAAAEKAGMPYTDIKMSDCGVEDVPTTEDWLEYARSSGIHTSIISFLEEYPEYYAYNHPKSWDLLSNSLKLVGASPDLDELEERVSTCLGRTFLTFKFARFYLKEATDVTN